MRKVTAYITILILGAFLGLGMMTLTFSYSNAAKTSIRKNVKASAQLLYDEGNFYKERDNITDALMLLNAAGIDTSQNAINQAMMVYRNHIEGGSRIENLMDYSNGLEMSTDSYAKYWHGYLLFLRPLLILTDYHGVRMVNMVLQALTIIFVLIGLVHSNTKRAIIPYLLTMLWLAPWQTMASLQYSSCFYVANIGMLAVLFMRRRGIRIDKYGYAFLIIGMLTSFFDFLTYPVVTWGLPAVLLISFELDANIWKKIWRVADTGLSWSVGYLGMWLEKWILAAHLTGQDVVNDGLISVRFRTSNEEAIGTSVSRVRAILGNGRRFLIHPATIAAIVVLLIFGVLAIVRRIKKKEVAITVTSVLVRAVPYLLIAMVPFIWYLLVANHSIIHCRMTWRDMVVSAFAGLVFIFEVFW